jgi:hypothetical protein
MTIQPERRGATRFKLQEAEFFLGFLKSHYGYAMKFDFYLSAFMSAARSVLLIMRAEFEKVEGWEAWYQAEQSRADQLLKKGTTEARNRSLKSDPLRTLGGYALYDFYSETGDPAKAGEQMRRIAQSGLPVNIFGTSGRYKIEANIDGEPVVLYARDARIDRTLEEFPGERIPDVCQRYYDWLAKLVGDCEAKFGTSTDRTDPLRPDVR